TTCTQTNRWRQGTPAAGRASSRRLRTRVPWTHFGHTRLRNWGYLVVTASSVPAGHPTIQQVAKPLGGVQVPPRTLENRLREGPLTWVFTRVGGPAVCPWTRIGHGVDTRREDLTAERRR